MAQEAAFALLALASDPPGLLVGCRLVVDYHPENVALWWVCARAVTSMEPRGALRDCLEQLHDAERRSLMWRDEEWPEESTDGNAQEDVVWPWDVTMSEMQRAYPEAVHLLRGATSI